MKFRILSLDGGGAWALIQVRALQQLYGAQQKGHAILQDFDLVVANSGGSLVLGGLLEDLRLDQILDYFQDEKKRKAIFHASNSIADWLLRHLAGIGPRYEAKRKLPAIQALMPKTGAQALSSVTAGLRRSGRDNDSRLLVVGFDYDVNRAKFFRSYPSNTRWGRGGASNAAVAEVIHASTNAPVNYFDAPAQFATPTPRYWDGAVSGYNNPVFAAVLEAIMLEQPADQLVALSIGTGNVCLPPEDSAQPPYFREHTKTGLKNDLKKLATSILDDPPDAATFHAHVVTGGNANVVQPADSCIVRMNPLVSPVRGPDGAWTAPKGLSAAEFKALVNLDMDAVECEEVKLIQNLASLWLADAVPNQPIRMDWDTLQAEIGFARFSEALAAWQAIQ